MNAQFEERVQPTIRIFLNMIDRLAPGMSPIDFEISIMSGQIVLSSEDMAEYTRIANIHRRIMSETITEAKIENFFTSELKQQLVAMGRAATIQYVMNNLRYVFDVYSSRGIHLESGMLRLVNQFFDERQIK